MSTVKGSTVTATGFSAVVVSTIAAYLKWLGGIEVPTEVLVGTTGVVSGVVAFLTHKKTSDA